MISNIIHGDPEYVPDEQLDEIIKEELEAQKDLQVWDHVVVNENCQPPHFAGMVGIVLSVDKVRDPETKVSHKRIGVNIIGNQVGHNLDGRLPEDSKRGFYFLESDLIRVG